MIIVLGVLAVAAIAFNIALSMDGVVSGALLEMLASFPLKGTPVTNGVVFGFAIGLTLMAAALVARHFSP